MTEDAQHDDDHLLDEKAGSFFLFPRLAPNNENICDSSSSSSSTTTTTNLSLAYHWPITGLELSVHD